ncbi:hypothetical protein [Fervidibacter sacchari]|uniref:Uncharacterized protein n=1 Tax=Candidatus Fervidibacter sacchari TaxID=1448929 RepID=A0ABT2EV85_9BACT|nr:hypothetical protein [Candidatus Fervidibacter sacchari]MCS3920830.1 hypothetical protein [Candidatus Fervidibacter sacchari]WKU17836.1 hypothetical protein Q2T83_08480 [Candidatus Fervidibacter sacchari]
MFGADAPHIDQLLIAIRQSLPFRRSPIRGENLFGADAHPTGVDEEGDNDG